MRRIITAREQFAASEIWRTSMALPEGYTFEFTPSRSYVKGEDGKPVGHLLWHSDGEVRNIMIDEDHQRKGLATELYNQTAEHLPSLHHSEELTPEGRAWSKTLGWDPEPPPSPYDIPDTEGSVDDWEPPKAVMDFVNSQPPAPTTEQERIDQMGRELAKTHPELMKPEMLRKYQSDA